MVEIRQSTIIDAPIESVWSILRDFNGHDRWHPAIASSVIEGGRPADMIGAVRAFRLDDGGELREQLLSLSDRDHAFTYCLLGSPLPLMGYVASVTLKPVTDGDATFWEWRSEFHPPAARRAELVKLVTEDIYQAGFRAIAKQFDMRSKNTVSEMRRLERPQPSRSLAPPPSARGGAGKRSEAMQANWPMSTNAIVIERYGGPDVMQLRKIPLRPPADGEVLIRHTAIGVNFIDVYCRTGYFDLLQLPGVPGMEAAGVVEMVGSGVAGLSVGDRVAYACPPVGAYCERRAMSPDFVVRLSPDTPDDIAAASLLKGVTASFLLHDVHAVQPGETILIHAAAGGVGQLLVQWARHLGARVIATVSSDEKAGLVAKLGADHVVVYSREDFVDAAMRLTEGRGVDVAYDAVGNDTFGDSIAALGRRGHLVSFGQASGPVGNWDIGRFSSKSITVSRPNYAHYIETPAMLASHVTRFFGVFRNGAVRVEPPTPYRLEEAAEAHRAIESRRTTGALILRT